MRDSEVDLPRWNSPYKIPRLLRVHGLGCHRQSSIDHVRAVLWETNIKSANGSVKRTRLQTHLECMNNRRPERLFVHKVSRGLILRLAVHVKLQVNAVQNVRP